MSDFQHGWGDSRPNEGKAFSILTTREGFAMVPLSTGGDGGKLECVDEGFPGGILLAG
jgi:ATP adenylyltransferase/5',5'''-P-1,P-4-tetraphosphate phosphorylase II